MTPPGAFDSCKHTHTAGTTALAIYNGYGVVRSGTSHLLWDAGTLGNVNIHWLLQI